MNGLQARAGVVALMAAGLLATPACQLGTTGLEPIAVPGAPLPDDVEADSLSRMPLVQRESLDEYGQQMFDMVGAGDPDNPLRGPAAISLYSPHVAEAMHLLNQYLRNDSPLGARYGEVAILVAAREMDQAYEWSGHEPRARAAGVPDNVIEVIKNDLDIVGMSPQDANIIRMGRQIFRQHRLTPDVWIRAVEYFGQQGAVDLTALMGDYAMAAIMLTAVDQQLPPDRTATLPARPDYVRE